MPTLRRLLIAPLAALVLGLAACGGSSAGGDGAAATTTVAPSSGGVTAPAETTAPAPTTAATPTTQSSSVDGAKVVADQGCMACHKLPAGGAPGPGPSLLAEGTILNAQQIEAKLIQGPDEMPSYANLRSDSPRDFTALVDYIASLKG